jgi:hypothetical protein
VIYRGSIAYLKGGKTVFTATLPDKFDAEDHVSAAYRAKNAYVRAYGEPDFDKSKSDVEIKIIITSEDLVGKTFSYGDV